MNGMERPVPVEIHHMKDKGVVRITWDDGHNTGIYTFDHLRSLCPCPDCKK